ncbi:toprim domain-containing protein [Spirillospora sp. NBC_01491]|uniref:toprim domain-containing protein n=1 Tax=Spirillospora sp. NBC_01491 TaxID=2976007 RepID=UPI002E31CC13|nr:toprim domain-containing protein [Spirillospora sp. NBC_01491]
MPGPDDQRLPALLRGIAERETARLRDGTLPWTWWLEHAAKHGRYGFTNTLLICAQWRAATDVRAYEEWRTAGRQVRKGETGIRILPDANGPLGRRTTRTAGPRAVFDFAQTDGLPFGPSAPATPRQAWDRLLPLAVRYGLHAERPQDDLDAVWRVAHQLAHALRSGDRIDPPDPSACDGLRRIEADSVAFLVLARCGLAPPRTAFPASAPWAAAPLGDRILRLVQTIHEQACFAGDLLPAAHRFFRARLADGWVPAYLEGRGFPSSVQQQWRIGYAPRGTHALTDHLRGLGHDDAAILAAGLARRGRGGRLYDVFRDRAMFAIRTADGRIAGFIGRLPDGGTGPKYLNSPDSAFFHKGDLLYGLHEARERFAGGARPVLVEGPLDAIAVGLAAAPREHAAVAACGLSLTAAQLAALGRAADLDRTGLVLALDGDPAGRTAALRAWETLAPVGGPVEAVPFPTGRDPADLLREEGPGAVRRALSGTAGLMDLVVDGAVERSGGTLGTPEQRLAAIRAAAAVIAAGRPAEAAAQVVRVAARLGVDAGAVTDALVDAVSPAAPP